MEATFQFSGLELALMGLASFIGSFTSASFGFGGGILLMLVFPYFMPITLAVPVHAFIQLASNTGRCYLLRSRIKFKPAILFGVGSLAGALLPAAFILEIPEKLLSMILVVFIIIILWIPIPPVSEKLGHKLLPSAGFASGFTGMFIGASGFFINVILRTFRWDRRNYTATAAFGMMMNHITKIIGFMAAGIILTPYIPFMVLMSLVGFAGTWCGRHLVLEKLSNERFYSIMKFVLTLLALHLALKAFGVLT